MHLVLLAAMTANGFIARSTNELANWTSKEDKKFFVSETKLHKAVIMGRTTYATIGRALPERFILVLTTKPEAIETIPGSVEPFTGTPQEAIALLESRGFTSAVIAGGSNVYSQFLNAGLVNELALTVEPTLFVDGIRLADKLEKEISLAPISIEKLGEQSILARYKIV